MRIFFGFITTNNQTLDEPIKDKNKGKSPIVEIFYSSTEDHAKPAEADISEDEVPKVTPLILLKEISVPSEWTLYGVSPTGSGDLSFRSPN